MGRHKKTFKPKHQIIFTPNLIYYVLNFSDGKFTRDAENILKEISRLSIRHPSHTYENATTNPSVVPSRPDPNRSIPYQRYITSNIDELQIDFDDDFLNENWDSFK